MNFVKLVLACMSCFIFVFLLLSYIFKEKDIEATKYDIIKEDMINTGFPAEILTARIVDLYPGLKNLTLHEACLPEDYQMTSNIWNDGATFFDVAIENVSHIISYLA